MLTKDLWTEWISTWQCICSFHPNNPVCIVIVTRGFQSRKLRWSFLEVQGHTLGDGVTGTQFQIYLSLKPVLLTTCSCQKVPPREGPSLPHLCSEILGKFLSSFDPQVLLPSAGHTSHPWQYCCEDPVWEHMLKSFVHSIRVYTYKGLKPLWVSVSLSE